MKQSGERDADGLEKAKGLMVCLPFLFLWEVCQVGFILSVKGEKRGAYGTVAVWWEPCVLVPAPWLAGGNPATLLPLPALLFSHLPAVLSPLPKLCGAGVVRTVPSTGHQSRKGLSRQSSGLLSEPLSLK